jgi:IS30 family transposase
VKWGSERQIVANGAEEQRQKALREKLEGRAKEGKAMGLRRSEEEAIVVLGRRKGRMKRM